jgi:hypothetical protein
MEKSANEVFDEYNNLPDKEKKEFGRLLLSYLMKKYYDRTIDEDDIHNFIEDANNTPDYLTNEELIKNAVCLVDLVNTIENKYQKEECKKALQKSFTWYDYIHRNYDNLLCLLCLPQYLVD